MMCLRFEKPGETTAKQFEIATLGVKEEEPSEERNNGTEGEGDKEIDEKKNGNFLALSAE